MTTVSTWRLNLLRAGYLLLAAGMGSMVWPAILDPGKTWELMHGVVVSMLGALTALSLLGLRYPLQMLPLLFFEMGWKAIWLLRIALPLWSARHMDADTAETASECLVGAVFLFLIPWDYVLSHYLRKPGDPWLRRAAGMAPATK